MARRSVIRVKAVIDIPYDRRQFGAVTAAEAHCLGIQKALEQVLADANMVLWEARHQTAPAPSLVSAPTAGNDDGLTPPPFMRRG